MNLLSLDGTPFIPNSTPFQFEESIFNSKYIPSSYSLLQNNGSSLFTFILFSIILGASVEEKKNVPPSPSKLSHEIAYSSDEVQDFLERLERYEFTFEELASNSEKTTILISVLLGKLLLQELPHVQHTKTLSNISLPANTVLTFKNIAKILSFGTHRWDENHPIIQKRKIALQKKEKKDSLSLGLDANDESYASFCANPEDEAFNAYMAKQYNFIPKVPSGFNSYSSYGMQSASTESAYTPSYTPIFDDDQAIDRGSILYTLTFLVLLFPFDNEEANLLHLLELWVQARREIFNLQNGLSNDNEKSNFISDSSIQAFSDYALPFIEFLSDFQLISELGTFLPEVDIKSPFCVADGLLYVKLREMLKDPSQTNMILEQFLILLKRPERNLLNLFTSLCFFLPHFVISNENMEKIQEIMTCAKQFFMEPLPIGGLANSILKICRRKLFHEGSIEREQLLNTLVMTKENITINDESVPILKKKVVHVLFNPDSQYASTLKQKFNIFDPNTQNDVDEDDLHHSMANHVLNIFEKVSLLDEELLRQPEQTLSKYFYFLHRYCTQLECGEKNANEHLSFLKEIKAMILQDKENANSKKLVTRDRTPKLPCPHFKLIALPREIELENCKMERRIFPRSCMVDILQNIVQDCEATTLSTEDSRLVVPIAIAGGSGTLQRLAHSLVVISRLQDKPTEKLYELDLEVYLIPLGVNNHLSTWLEKHDPFYSRFWHMPIISPLTLGTSRTIEGRKYIQSQTLQSKERSRKSFYYTPVHTYRTKKATQSSDTPPEANTTLPVKDSIVENESRKEPDISSEKDSETVPQGQSVNNPSAKPNDDDKIQYTSPQSYFTRLLQNYVNEAHSKLPIHIYTAQCLCYDVSKRDLRNQNSSGTGGQTVQRGNSVAEYISLSFCQRLDIGIVSEAAHQMQTNSDFSNLSMEEVISHKDFKFQGLNLSISYLPMDPSGLAPSSQINDRQSVYHSICVKSTSIPGDTGVLASPDQPWLEVFSEDVTSQKRRLKLREEDYGGNSYHIAQLIVDSATAAKFHILMDGELYGPYHKIIIALDNKVKNFNMMTFGRPRINL